MDIFLENWYIPLLIAHLIGTIVLVGAATHNLVCVAGYVRGKFIKQRKEKRYGAIFFWSYLVVYVLGILIYPAFRVYIRHFYLDPALPWATGLFEVKEHWGAIALALLLVYYLLRKTFQPSQEKHKLYFYIPLCLLLNVILWYKVIIGCYLSLLKGSF